MAAFPSGLYQDKSTTIKEDSNFITDDTGNFKATYSSVLQEIKLVLSPLTEAEKDSIIAHYLANYAESVDLVVNAYNTGIIPVFYKSPPKIEPKGAIHYKVTCEFRS